MWNGFGLLSRLEFLQDFASAVMAAINPSIMHNLEKYYALKKVYFLSAIEDIEGDYLEFGVFTGSSFCHSMRCCKSVRRINPKILRMRFFGFDSFSGFGPLSEDDAHLFYTDKNFETSLTKVNKRVGKVAGELKFNLVPGYFSDSLKNGASALGISRARIIFIDSDTYLSAKHALNFCLPTVMEGTFVVLDDFFSYKGSETKGVARAFSEFIDQGQFSVRQVLTYGMGGAVFIVSGKKSCDFH
jgi:hypothetical protein